MISARDAITARDKPEHADLWASSGGDKLVDSFLSITADIMQARAGMLAQYTKDGTSLETASDALQLGGDDTSSRVWSPPALSVSDGETPEDDTNVIRIRPARPRRDVSRRDDKEPRERIDPDEANKLRAQVHEDSQIDDDARDLKSVFDVSDEPEMDEAEIAEIPEHEETADILEGVADEAPIEADAEVDETTATVHEAPNEEDTASDQEQDSDTLIASISGLVSEDEQDIDIPAETEIEQKETLDESAVVEPISKSAGQAFFSLPETTPLSAVDAWSEHVMSLDDTSDTSALMDEFQAFLENFDKRAREHHARQSEDGLQALGDETTEADTVWHVL
ncbi:hypothetical protein MWU76_19800 [Gelidibacter sp. F2691]|nr:hypothetical protein [Gelidibacter sp. F2691]